MLKFRCWDKTDQRFIYPVIDITNDFHSGIYTPDRFVFDKFIFEKNGIEYFENDIILHNFENSKRSGKFKEIMCLIEPFDPMSFHGYNLLRYADYCLKRWQFNVHHNSDIYHTEWKYRRSNGSTFNGVTSKLGNLHQNKNLLIDHYKEKYFENNRPN
jgi:hypothetical protein